MSFEERKSIIETIKTLKEKHLIQVFTIISKYTNEFNNNSNGIFFESKNIPNECVAELSDYIQSIANQDDKDYDEYEKMRSDFINTFEKSTLKK